jgi:SAM-dependent methyltransferase
MTSYYDRLSAERLRRCYELAPPEVQAYLDAEVRYILASIRPGARVLELACGYGRVLAALAKRSGWLVGIDLSLPSLALARRQFLDRSGVALAQMNVAILAFRPATFDLICCPQNGISAVHVDQRALIASTLRLVAPGGKALFFSYADAFWPHRLGWFRIQAAHGLVGEINESATGNGTIVCNDGFKATTVCPDGFLELTRGLGTSVAVSVLNGSSVVCTITA